ncbi:MAG TPA: hypothetical protein VNG12_08015 [Acidimicrobiales bacterium]|nr:hypothetical protein [Acidimicrobiales bacterium]
MLRKEAIGSTLPARGVGRPYYPGGMRRLLTIVLVIVAVGVVRAVLMDRAPRRGLHGEQPVIGSLDTWPDVPRRPTI